MSGSNLQIGKTGPKIKISSGIVEFRNATDSAYAVARAGNPIDDDDAVPKAWAATNIGDSGIPLSIIRKSDTTGTDTYTLPTAVAGDTITVSKHSSQQITNILRIQPASGDKIAIYGSVIENPGYIEVYDAATVFKFHSLNADIWALASHFRKTEFGELINQGKFALFGRDTWVTKTNLTTGVSGAGSFDANGYAYVLCGNTGAITNLTQQYNDSTNAWAAKTVNPTSRYLLCGLTLNGFGYTTCGNPAVNTSTGAHTQYNDAGNSWTAKTANPTVRETASVMSFNGYCYVVGGSSNGTANVQTVNNQYNDATNAFAKSKASSSNGFPNLLNAEGLVIKILLSSSLMTSLKSYIPMLCNFSKRGCPVIVNAISNGTHPSFVSTASIS